MKNAHGRIRTSLLLVLLAVVAIAGVFYGRRVLDRTAPAVTITSDLEAIGRGTRLTIEANEPKYGVRRLAAALVQEGVETPLGEWSNPSTPWWRVTGRTPEPTARLEVTVGSGAQPGLKEGTATIRVEAVNDSPARFGGGRTTVAEKQMPVLLTPPRVEVLSDRHYVRHGGSECVVYRVIGDAVSSGVRAGGYFFPGHELPHGRQGELFALFAFPEDLSPSTVPVVVASDAAANESVATFPYTLLPGRFHDATIPITDDFLKRVVPPIVAASPSITSTGDPLKDFLELNGRLRRENAASLVELSKSSRPERLWHGAFTQLGRTQVEASFADRRTYLYEGRAVDHQVHLGFDLAATSNYPVEASNDGVVAMTGYFGIYGNTVVVDHGFGLMTLYAHLSSIDVSEGQTLKRGDVIGRTGATGMAGGDHLHFSIMIDGVPVDPTEWWDPSWVGNRIESKLGTG